jgi:hypothetical protein
MSSASDLQAWHDFDWRFFLPDPRIGRAWVASECAGTGDALREIGVEVSGVLDDRVEIAFLDRRRLDPHELERRLSPGTIVGIAVRSERTDGLRSWLRSRRRWRLDLEPRGWQVLARVWAAPRIDGARAYADLDNRRAIMHWWRMQPRARARTRLKVTVMLTLARLGWWRLTCREGFVFVRTP